MELRSFVIILLIGAGLLGIGVLSFSFGLNQGKLISGVGPLSSFSKFLGIQSEPSNLKERVRYQPHHVHLAYGEHPTEMVVTWTTMDETEFSSVEYWKNGGHSRKVNGYLTKFTDPGGIHLVRYIHRVTLRDLEPGQMYWYHCGGDLGWSSKFSFVAMPEGQEWSPRLAIYGDMGNENAQSLPRLQREVQMGDYDAIIHVGDFAYDMHSYNGRIGDSFFDQIETIAAYVPYMTCPGNHEQKYNFSHYKNRFSMPGPYENMMYSWDMGPIHFVGITTEFYYFLKYGVRQAFTQYEWLQEDLMRANLPENREKRPWIIVYGHRPMYCSNTGTKDCRHYDAATRVGLPFIHLLGLEELFMENGVDLALWGHEHSYERLLPMYNYQLYNGTVNDPYNNPKAVVHVTTGSAGCWEEHAHFQDERPPWSAFRSSDYGYSRLRVINRTHLHFEQVSDDQGGKVIDSFHLIRENHKAYAMPYNPMESDLNNY